jgi:ABC-2 type transport system ATP-binding protein
VMDEPFSHRSGMVQASGLRRVFRARAGDVAAVNGVDLEVKAGEVFGFLGPNGAGKSTTIRMLVTLLAPTAGWARVAGFDIRRNPEQVRRRIGYVAQGGATLAVETGQDELVMQARAFGAPREAASRRAGELIARFGLEEVADRRTGSWSGGQRRRLDIALGLVHRPAVLFLDEPTTGLDPQSRASLWDEIRRLAAEGITVFLTTHYLDEADALADRVAIIDHGRVVAEGAPDELKRQIAGDVVAVGAGAQAERAYQVLRAQPYVRSAAISDSTIRMHVEDGAVATVAIVRLLDAAGLAPTSLALKRPSLDDVFLTQTGRSLREGNASPATAAQAS